MQLESYRAVRWIRTINLVLQAVLITSFFVGLNYVALQYNWRWDLTRSNRHSLSPETRSYIGNLKRPVKVIVTLTDDYQDPDVATDIRGLLREYVFASEASGNEGRISVEFLDPYQRPHDAEQLDVRDANTIFFLSGDKRRAILPSEIYRVEAGEKRECLGEQIFTAALLDVTAAERKKVYFLTGHGEFQPDDPNPSRGLSVLRDALRSRNFSTALLDLTNERKVPEDAALVIVAAPDRIEPFAQEELRKYLSGRAAGRMIVLLAPRVAHGLTDLLLDWGVLLGDNDIIVDSNPRNVTEDGNLRIAAFTPHPITRALIDNQLPVIVGLARSLGQAPGMGPSTGVATVVLAAAEESAWGSRHSGTQQIARFQPGDIRGSPRLGLITASERVQARDNLKFSVRSGRLVVFGSADLATNNRLSGAPGNQAIILNSINWAVDRDAQLAIPPRPIERFQLSLSQEQLSRLRYSLWFGVPGIAALFGFFVHWTRRS